MTLTRFLLLLVMSILVTVPVIWFIPRARQSPFFDRLLWLATAVVAFLSAWLALGFASGITFDSWSTFAIADVTIAPALVGAAAGALLLNLSLWVIDLFNQPAEEEDIE